MLRFCKACNGSFLFSFQFDQKLPCKNSFFKLYLKLNRPVFLKCFLIVVDMFLIKKDMYPGMFSRRIYLAELLVEFQPNALQKSIY